MEVDFQPTKVYPEPPTAGEGNWFVRTLRAFFFERRLPTSVQRRLDHMLIRCGLPLKTIRAGGFRFRVRRQSTDEHFVREVIVDENYFPEHYKISPGDTVIDVGGNIGAFSIPTAALTAPTGRVIAVEPVSANVELLEMNQRLNRLENLEIKRAAISSKQGQLRIYLSLEGQGSHSSDATLAGSSDFEEVEGITLQHLFERSGVSRCNYLKLDCEGAEFEIIETMSEELARKIDRIVLEYHVIDGQKHESALVLLKKLQQLGFTIDRYTDIVDTPYGLIYSRRT